MIRIFYVIDSFDLGGAQRQLLELICHLSPQEYIIAVCAIWPLKNLEPDYLQTGVEIIQIYKRHRYDFAFIFRLALKMRRFKPDIVHTWLFSGSLWGRLAAILANVPIIVMGERNVYPNQKYPKWVLLINRILAHWTDKITVNCKYGVEVFLNRGFDRKKIQLIYNGVNLEHFSQNENKHLIRYGMREKLKIPDNLPVVTMVGRLTEQKGQGILLKAIKLVAENGIDVCCLLVGDGEDREILYELSKSLGISTKVHFLGKRMDIADLLVSSDIFVLSSNWEGMPNVVLEAMALRLPVVATNVPGTAELVIDGKTGFLFPIGDSVTLAEQILVLIRNPRLRKCMGKIGREICEKEFSIDKMATNTSALYCKLIEAKRSAND